MPRDNFRATLVLMAGFAAATLTGFLRQAVLADQFGASRAMDTFLVAFAVPEFVFIALPIVLSPAFLPIFAGLRQKEGEAAAWHFGMRTGAMLLGVLVLLTALAMLAAPLYIRWLSPGFTPQERILAVRGVRLMLPSLSLMGLATYASTALQVYRRFLRPAFLTAVYNLAFILTLLFLPGFSIYERAALGVTLGAAAALALQIPAVWWFRPALQARQSLTQASYSPGDTGQLIGLAAWFSAGYAAHHLILFIDRAMATSLGAGSAAALSFGLHLALAVGQLSSLPVSTVLFPQLAEEIGRGDRTQARRSLIRALKSIWMIALPASAGLIILRQPLVEFLFARGAFDQAATQAVTPTLIWYGLAVLVDALCQPLWRVIYAQKRAPMVLQVNGLQTIIRIICNVMFTMLWGYIGLAISAVVGLSVQLVVLSWLALRSLGKFSEIRWGQDFARPLLACLAASLVVSLIAVSQSLVTPLILLMISGVAGGIIYLVVLLAPNPRRFGRRL
jgi:putative peptidoglycan lipid II flippase